MSITELSFDVLLVEPDSDNVDRFTEAFEKTSVEADIHGVSNKEEALGFIHQRDEHTNISSPDLILLDRNLPNVNSENILATVKEDPELRQWPVLVMGEENAEDGAQQMYDLNVNAYIQKPVDSEEFETVVDTITRFWFRTARLPP